MDALRVTRQAANGLAAAHAQDIVHRDVKPQNLVLLEDGTVKVVDFGLAGVAQISGGRVGTPHFMAPETCEIGEATTKSDVYSLGITLYHLLTGQAAVRRAGRARRSSGATCGATPLRPEVKRPGLPREVADLVRALTLQGPAARPTAAQVVESIDGFGGEAMQEKATLRRRRRRSRAHVAPGRSSSSSSGALLFAVFLVVGAIVAIIALGSTGDDGAKKKSSTTPTDAAGPSRPAAPAQPTPPGPSAPTQPPPGPDRQPDVPAAPPAVDAETAANTALFEAEQWARRNWKTTDDDEARDRRVPQAARTSTPGRRRRRRRTRASARSGRTSDTPHPDKEFSEADEVARGPDELGARPAPRSRR